MVFQGRNRRGTRRFVCLAVVGFAALGGVVLWQAFHRGHFRADRARMQRLRAAPLLSLPSAPAPTDEWPQWRGPNRDGVCAEGGLLSAWPEGGPPVLWRRPLGRGFSSLAVSGGRLYTMAQESDSEVVLCLDARTGREVWRFGYPNRYDERFGSGPRSTPAVEGGRVYAVGPTGIFHCLRADTGEKLWRHDLLEEFGAEAPRYGVAFSPLVEGELVYTLPGGPHGNAVAAFDKRTGRLAWKALDDPPGYSSPVAATLAGVRQVLFLTNTELVGLAPEDGRVLWRYPWEPSGGFNIATPLVFGDYVFVSSAYGKGCALVEVSAGPGGALRADTVYEHNRMRNYFASSVRCGGHLYGFDEGRLTCMDVRTGRVAWRESGRFKKGSLLLAGGQLIVLGEQGRLALVEASAEGYREVSAFEVSAQKCWTVPALAGGRLYVRDEANLVCLDLRAGRAKAGRGAADEVVWVSGKER